MNSFSIKGNVTELDGEKRTFGGYLTVEIKDHQGDVLPIEKIKELRILDIMKERGAPITMGHRDYPFAKFTGFKFTTRNVKGEEVPAIWFNAEAHKHYKTDNDAWNSLKDWHEKGLPIETSISWSKEASEIKCDGKDCANVWKQFGILSLAVLDPTVDAANSAATVETVSGAKSKEGVSFKFSQLCPAGKAGPCPDCPYNFLKTGERSAEYTKCSDTEHAGCGTSVGKSILVEGGGAMPKENEGEKPGEGKPDKPDKSVEEKQNEQENPLAAIEAMLTKIYDAIMSKQEPEGDPKTPEEEAEKARLAKENGEEKPEEEPDEKALTPDAIKKLVDEGVKAGVKARLEDLGIKGIETPGQKSKAEKGIAAHPAEEGAKGVITGSELAGMSDAEFMAKAEGGEFA